MNKMFKTRRSNFPRMAPASSLDDSENSNDSCKENAIPNISASRVRSGRKRPNDVLDKAASSIENSSESCKESIDTSRPSTSARLDNLLRHCESYANFLNPENPSEHQKPKIEASKKSRNQRKQKHEEDAELLAISLIIDAPNAQTFVESPSFICGGTMRDYQVQGLNWMISLFENNINGVLADEMGLGKTLQTISMLGYMKHMKNDVGPHIVIVPKSTHQNWLNEFKKWCPTLVVRGLLGDKSARPALLKDLKTDTSWNVVVTTYEMIKIESYFFQNINWNYLVLDEAHCIKNEKTVFSQIMRKLKSKNRLLLTGTPLQNNLHDLWALLNFLLPKLFSDAKDFDIWFDTDDCLNDMTLVARLQSILKPFMLRRLKSDVEKSLLPKKVLNIFVGLSSMQREWYKNILQKNVSAINGCTGEKSKMKLDFILMHLRKCCNHPYLFVGAEPGPPYTTADHLVNNCGKMVVLDKLLAKLKAQGSRVLLFTQMVKMMDILEDYCDWKGYSYHRLDGGTDTEHRTAAIDQYNSPDSQTFIFMLSTRAGGLGINLVSADTVILYDSDWNPQMDLQAMDRAHRIGQKKQVYVYRMITENTVDEKMFERAQLKLRLDKLVIQQDTILSNNNESVQSKNEMLDIIRFGANELIAGDQSDPYENMDIEQLLAVGEKRTKELQKKLKDTEGTVYYFEGEIFKPKPKIDEILIQPAKRARRHIL